MEFVVFPDRPAVAVVATAAEAAATQRIDHASGRPWVVGAWSPGEAEVVEAGTRRLVLLGHARRDKAVTASVLGRMRSLHELDEVVSGLPGVFHLIASVDGRTRVQGSVCGMRQVFTTVVDGVTVAASGVGPLLRLVDADLDETLLAARLLSPGGAPWPLAPRPVRRGIDPLATGHWLEIAGDGRARQHRWWELPEPSLSLEEGAEAVRAALVEAVAVRAARGGTISADLSGGLDSTALCFLSDAAGVDLVTYHVTPLDRANQDAVWAHRAAELIPRARHRTLAADRSENLFDVGYDAQLAGAAPEGPASWASGLAHFRDLARRAAGDGSCVHLTGFGGDELFGRTPVCAWSLARDRPVVGLRSVNRYRLANRWSWRATVRELLDRSTFAQSLRAVAGRIDGAPPPLDEPDFGWVSQVRMPAWATREAVESVRRLLRTAAAENPGPLDADRTRHQALESLTYEGGILRNVDSALAGTGVVWDAPFLDDHVVRAALSTAIDQRLASGRSKPLLTTALQGIVPAEILARRDKGEFSAEAFRGLERNRSRIIELFEDSQLARLGLIDAAAFRSEVLNPGPMWHHLQPIETTVACESWLRTHHQPRLLRTGERA